MAQNVGTFKNISYSALARMVAFAFQAAANLVLSRELVSTDYGIMNFAMIQITLMTTLSDFGINNAAVQREECGEETLYTAFTIKLVLSLLTYALIYFTAPCLNLFFDNPNVVDVIRLLGLVMVMNTFAFIPCTVLSRSLKLKKVVIAETANTVANSVIAVAMAVNGFGFWSIAAAYVGANAIFVLMVNIFHHCRPVLRFDRKVALELVRYAQSVLLYGLISFTVLNLDNFLVGSVSGSSILGYYALAFNWGSMVCGIMSSVVLSVLFPTLARMQDDRAATRQAYLEVLRYISIFCVLWNLTLFCVSDLFLVHVLGKGTAKWLPALNSLRILCLYGIVRSLVDPTKTLLMASGNPKLVLRAGALAAVLELILVYPAIRYGSIEAVSLVVLLAYSCQIYFTKTYVAEMYQVCFSDLFSIVWPVCSSAVAVSLLYFLFHGLLHDSFGGLILGIIMVAFFFIIIYGVSTRWKYYSQIYCKVRN